MDINGKVAIVTGAGAGIGAALAQRLVVGGARVLLADLNESTASAVAAKINEQHPSGADSEQPMAIAFGGDVSNEAVLRELIDDATTRLGPIDIFFANAGTTAGLGLDSTDEQWSTALDVNTLAHVRAAKLLVPQWLERGSGYFVSTASAAGLLTQIGSVTYSVTKHAAVGFAEWLSVTYGHRGIAVSCLCPMGVNTELLNSGFAHGDAAASVAARAVTDAGVVLEPEVVADIVMDGVEDERFLILPHAEVLEFYRNKGADYDRWIRGMQRYQQHLIGDVSSGAGVK